MRPIRSYAGTIRTGRAIVVHAVVGVAGFTLGALTGHFAVAMAATVAAIATAKWSVSTPSVNPVTATSAWTTIARPARMEPA